MVLEALKEEHTACLPQMRTAGWATVHWQLKFSPAYLEKTVLSVGCAKHSVCNHLQMWIGFNMLVR